MSIIRKLPIGIQDFEDLRTNNYVYVDKTQYLYRLVTLGKPYFLGRPRRFGKSLFLSTLKAYFEGKKHLFEGLAVAGLEKEWTKHPVVYIDFNKAAYTSLQTLHNVLNHILNRYEKQWGIEAGEQEHSLRFENVIRAAYEQTGKKVVILVDEYDKPLTGTMDDFNVHEDIRIALRGFYGVLKSMDAYLRFVFLTGVTKFSKISIFSDLNQPNDVSMDESYAGICGITEQEVLAGNVEEFMTMLQAYYAAIPYDLLHKEDKNERYCQMIFYLLFSLAGQFVETEVKSSKGRADAVVKTQSAIYVFEFKMDDKATAEDALAQMDDKAYPIPYIADHRQLVKIGVEFSIEAGGVKRWLIA